MTTKVEPVDMSAAAVAMRLEQVRALYKLMVSLQQVTVPRSVPAAKLLP